MLPPEKKNCFQQRLFEAIRKASPTNNIACVIIPEIFIRIFSRLEGAVFMTHLVYWCDRGNAKNAFIWKSFSEWKDETGLSQYQVTSLSRKFSKLGLLEMKKSMAMGHPTTFYKIKTQEFAIHNRDYIKDFIRDFK